ncbi:MAG TPA: divalent metal cation transporter [Firmicutes bacterium]|nr:divalent metal cation transporter [Bacillota bacterium]
MVEGKGSFNISEPPKGWRRLLFLGPGLVWSASAVGVGSLVFATRAGAIYGLALLWAPILTIFIKFFMTELIGRYTVATGENAVSAFGRIELKIGPLRLPAGWILWIFWLFFIVSVVGMSGIALTVGSTLQGLFPGLSYITWALAALLAAGLILYLGSYKSLQSVSRLLVAVIIFFIVYAVVKVPPSSGELLAGLMIRVPADSLQELVPLLGWAGAGAIGTIWFSMWTESSGRGAAGSTVAPLPGDRERIKGWIRVHQIDLGINTVLTALLTVGFLIAGAAILQPVGLVPGGDELGLVLARIAGNFFGKSGEVIFLVGIFGTLYSTLVANIDGLCRVAAGALKDRFGRREVKSSNYRLFVAVYIVLSILFATILPSPVILLQLTAVIDTLLLPVVACLAVYICRRYLPAEYRPGRFSVAMTYFSALFFVFFIILLISAVMRGVSFSL